MIYKLKIDNWFYISAVSFSVIGIFFMIYSIIDFNILTLILFLLLLLVVMLYYVPIILKGKYEIKDSYLHIQFGMLCKNINYIDILKIEKSNNPVSSYCVSNKKVEIELKNGKKIYISSIDNESLIEELNKKIQ